MARSMTRSVAVMGILLGLFLGGCPAADTGSEGEETPRVVSTSTIIADLTETIAANKVEHAGILEPGADPHIYEPVPRDSIAFEKADLILYNGFNLEPGLIKSIEAVGVDAKKVAVGEVVTPLDFEYEGQREPDPHVWGDVQNAIAMVEAIRDELIALSPEDEAIFTENAAQLIEELERLDTWIGRQISTIPRDRRQLVTTHDAFQYYADAYGLTVAGTLIGISTEEQPSARTVKNLAEEIKKTGIPVIFAETTLDPRLISTVAREAGVKLAPQELYSDSVGAPGTEGESYIKMLVANTRAIVGALGGTDRPFIPNAQ